MQAGPREDRQSDERLLPSAGSQCAASANGGASHAPGKGPGVLGEGYLSTLIAVASLAVPVSTLASVMELELAGLPVVMSASGGWIALAVVAVLCTPTASASASAPVGSADADEPERG